MILPSPPAAMRPARMRAPMRTAGLTEDLSFALFLLLAMSVSFLMERRQPALSADCHIHTDGIAGYIADGNLHGVGQAAEDLFKSRCHKMMDAILS